MVWNKRFRCRFLQHRSGSDSGTLKSRMDSGFANAFTAVFAWTEAVCLDKQSILQLLKSPTVNVWKWWSEGSDTNDLKIEMEILKVKMKMVNVTQMRIETEMLNGVANCRGSVAGTYDPVFLSSCFPISILDSVWVFLMAFTSSAFAFTFSFTSLCSFFTSTSLLSLLLSLFEFMLLYLL